MPDFDVQGEVSICVFSWVQVKLGTGCPFWCGVVVLEPCK